MITRYEIEPATGVKGSQVVNLAKDLARSLSLVSIRVVETIPGKNYMALELPNARRQTIRLAEILGSQVYNDAASQLTIGLGKDIVGKPFVADLAKMPHCLVAGTTGSGKSVGINAMILSLLYKAEARDVRLILIDPKMLELSVYEGIPHLLCPVVTDMKQAANALNWCVGEMERRYKLMSKLGVRNLAGYNRKIDEATERGESIGNPFSLTPEAPEPLERLPQIVVVIDELADLMMVVGKKIEELIARLAQKARACGIHLVLATQRPSVDVITGLIKANIPTRLSFQVSSKIDSRTILDQMGAEALLGQGDMLYLSSPTGVPTPMRVHGAFVSDEEVHRVVEYLRSQGEPNYIEGLLEGGVLEGEGEAGASIEGGAGGGEADPMYDQAVAIVLQHRRASISLVQRHLRIGYNRAARLLEQMEKSGLVSAMGTNGNRDIIVPRDERRMKPSFDVQRLALAALVPRRARAAPRRCAGHPARVRARGANRARGLHADRDLGRRREEEGLQRQLRVCAAQPLPLRLHQALRAADRLRRAEGVDLRRRPEPGHGAPAEPGAGRDAGGAAGRRRAGQGVRARRASRRATASIGCRPRRARRTARSSRCASAFAARNWRRWRSSTPSASARCCSSASMRPTWP